MGWKTHNTGRVPNSWQVTNSVSYLSRLINTCINLLLLCNLKCLFMLCSPCNTSQRGSQQELRPNETSKQCHTEIWAAFSWSRMHVWCNRSMQLLWLRSWKSLYLLLKGWQVRLSIKKRKKIGAKSTLFEFYPGLLQLHLLNMDLQVLVGFKYGSKINKIQVITVVSS